MEHDGKPLSEALIKTVEKAVEVAEDYGDLLKVFPYAKKAFTAYRWVKNRRVKVFFRALDATLDSVNDRDRARFARIVDSEEGRELMAEYCDSVLRTSSRTACAALGILYADVDNEAYSEDFKKAACFGLQGISEDAIDLFLKLLQIAADKPRRERKPYWVHTVTEGEWEGHGSGRSHIPAESVAPYTHDLINRGLLRPNPGTPFGIPVPNNWQVAFGTGGLTKQFQALLTQARKFLEKNSSA